MSSKINNKNIINLYIQDKKKKKKRTINKYIEPIIKQNESSFKSPYFSNTSNLQTEILRENLNNLKNPNIDRMNYLESRFRDDNFIRVGNADEETDVKSNFDETQTPVQEPRNRRGSYKDNRNNLLEIYRNFGGNNPLILNSTRKATIESAINELERNRESDFDSYNRSGYETM